MNKVKILSFLILCAFLLRVQCTLVGAQPVASEEDFEVYMNLHVLMAESTFFVIGPSKANRNRQKCGTVFLLNHPRDGADVTTKDWKGDLVLVTAAHVLDEIEGEYLTIAGRIKKTDGSWEQKPSKYRFRKGMSNLYVKHPTCDVAAMWLESGSVSTTPFIELTTSVPTFFLASDETASNLRLNIGSSLSCLGYPLCQACNSEGFSILRSGTIASYPLFPLRKRETFKFDFEVHPGNSGGPVYYFEPGFKTSPGAVTMRKTAGGVIVGLVTAQDICKVPSQDKDGKSIEEETPIKLGIVIAAPIIMDTIGMLPKRSVFRLPPGM